MNNHDSYWRVVEGRTRLRRAVFFSALLHVGVALALTCSPMMRKDRLSDSMSIGFEFEIKGDLTEEPPAPSPEPPGGQQTPPLPETPPPPPPPEAQPEPPKPDPAQIEAQKVAEEQKAAEDKIALEKKQKEDEEKKKIADEEKKKKEEEKKKKAEEEKKKKEEADKKKKEEEAKKKAEDKKNYNDLKKPQQNQPLADKKGKNTGPYDPRALPTEGPKKTGGQVQGIPSELSGWARTVQLKVERCWVQPPGLQLTDQNQAWVSFWVDKDGNLMSEPEVIKQASDPELGESGIRAIKQAVPLPPLPPETYKLEQEVVYVFTLVQ